MQCINIISLGDFVKVKFPFLEQVHYILGLKSVGKIAYKLLVSLLELDLWKWVAFRILVHYGYSAI